MLILANNNKYKEEANRVINFKSKIGVGLLTNFKSTIEVELQINSK